MPRFVTASRRHAISRSNAVDDIIRYIKTLLTPVFLPRAHRRADQTLRASLFALDYATLSWSRRHTYAVARSLPLSLSFLSLFSPRSIPRYYTWLHDRHSNLEREVLPSLGNKSRIFAQARTRREIYVFTRPSLERLRSFKLFTFSLRTSSLELVDTHTILHAHLFKRDSRKVSI